jgi:signal transduction histidine kinase
MVHYLQERKQGETEATIAKMSRAAERSIAGLKRCEEIIHSLQRFSRKDVEGKRDEDIHEGINATLALLPVESGKKVTIHRDYQFKGRLYCDLGQLNQVFLNVLANAYHAVGEEGTVWIRTGQKGDEVVVSVEDNGDGIAPENLSRIFEPFYTTKEVGKGTGLGLSIAHKIIENHGGRIEVESVVGKGSTFSVHLPLKNQSPFQQQEKDESNVRKVAGL